LSGGNKIAQSNGVRESGTHWLQWEEYYAKGLFRKKRGGNREASANLEREINSRGDRKKKFEHVGGEGKVLLILN